MKGMRICVTARPLRSSLSPPPADRWLHRPGLRAAGELAPELATPWIVKLRYGMALGQLLIVLVAYWALKGEFPLFLLVVPIAVMIATNLALDRMGGSRNFSRSWIGAIFCIDAICLTFVLAMTGGPTNPFTLLYLVQITLSAVILNRLWTWSLGLLSTFGFALLFWFHRPFPPMELADHGHMHPAHLQGMFLAFAVAATLISFFIGKVSEILRKAERDVLELQEGAAKNDRLASLVTLAAGAAHELATPMGTIAVVAKELEHHAMLSMPDADLLEDARLVRSEVERCRLILQRMSAREVDTEAEEIVPVRSSNLISSAIREFSQADQARIRTAETLTSKTLSFAFPHKLSDTSWCR